MIGFCPSSGAAFFPQAESPIANVITSAIMSANILAFFFIPFSSLAIMVSFDRSLLNSADHQPIR
jgi:hypothetical protein